MARTAAPAPTIVAPEGEATHRAGAAARALT
jgi:hypothetical protein